MVASVMSQSCLRRGNFGSHIARLDKKVIFERTYVAFSGVALVHIWRGEFKSLIMFLQRFLEVFAAFIVQNKVLGWMTIVHYFVV